MLFNASGRMSVCAQGRSRVVFHIEEAGQIQALRTETSNLRLATRISINSSLL
jgi:hypothetical protein